MADLRFPPMICLTGIDGCGKSTHRRLLAEALTARGFQVTGLSVWDIAQNPRYHHHAFISDREAIHRYLTLLHGGARALFILHALHESLALAAETVAEPSVPMKSSSRIMVADGYWYKYVFTEHLHGQPLEWLLQVVAGFPRPVGTILLDLEPSEAWARKPSITPYECGFQPPSERAFLDFQVRLRDIFHRRAVVEGWKSVSVTRPISEVSAEIIRIAQEWLEKAPSANQASAEVREP